MNTHEPKENQHSLAHRDSADTSAIGFVRVHSLIKTSDAKAAFYKINDDLILLVNQWPAGAVLTVAVSTERNGKEITILFQKTGTPYQRWFDDLQDALRGIYTLDSPVSGFGWNPVAPAQLLQLTVQVPQDLNNLPDVQAELDDGLDDTLRRELAVRAAINRDSSVYWPAYRIGGVVGVINALRGHTGVELRFQLAAATDIERELVEKELKATTNWSLALRKQYLHTIIRQRTFAAGLAGSIPAIVKARLADLGVSLQLKELDPVTNQFRWDTSDALAGAAIPGQAALNQLHLPAIGEGVLLGIRAEDPPVLPHPLEPEPEQPGQPVPLGYAYNAFHEQVSVASDIYDLPRHWFIEGAAGSGKSTALITLTESILKAGYSVSLIDSHGTTIDEALKRIPRAMVDKVSVIRHGDQLSPYPVNFLAAGNDGERQQRVEEFAEMIQELQDPGRENIVGPRWHQWFRLMADVSFALLEKETSLQSIVTLSRLLASDKETHDTILTILSHQHDDIRRRLIEHLRSINSQDSISLLEWVHSKMSDLITSNVMKRTVGLGVDPINVTEYIDDGRSLFIDLAMPSIGDPTARMLGMIWILKHWVALTKRKDRTKPHIIILDEAHLFGSTLLPKLLSEARKFGIGVILATQSIQQFNPKMQDAIEANVSSFVNFRAGIGTVAAASGRHDLWPAAELIRLPDLSAATTLLRNGKKTVPFTLYFDLYTREAELTAKQQAERLEVEATVSSKSQQELSAPFRDIPIRNDSYYIARISHLHQKEETPDAGELIHAWLQSGQRQGALAKLQDRDKEPTTRPIPTQSGDSTVHRACDA